MKSHAVLNLLLLGSLSSVGTIGRAESVPESAGTETRFVRLVQKRESIDVLLKIRDHGDSSIAIQLKAGTGDIESVSLTRRRANPDQYAGRLAFEFSKPTSGDGRLQVDRNGSVQASVRIAGETVQARIGLGRLTTPVMTDDKPAAGRRVRQVAPEYTDTNVFHSLYLPIDWKPGGKYPLLVEYTGNRWDASGSTGKIEDANLGFGLTGGTGVIWVVLPCVEKGRKENAIRWWGDLDATLDYCKTNVPRICEQFGGDLDNVLICGFSRGAIAANFLGLADDEIGGLWKAFITHDHYDGVFRVSDEASALERLNRLNGRPQLICSALGTEKTKNYLSKHNSLRNITFLDVPVNELFTIPDGKIVHPHTDLWMHIDSRYRQQARLWLRKVVGQSD